jgi:hypothetical protein
MDRTRDVQPEASADVPMLDDSDEVWPVPGLHLEQTQTLDLQAE